ncbi:phosphodiester glycosidase family protein [Streptomyces sp. NPDC127092]|uniref:phosphodiester glycosidase family protein n=1 Tax=Streptomyces sp. NPDC127092 TaxID=3347135 RepID=UPI00365DC9D8
MTTPLRPALALAAALTSAVALTTSAAPASTAADGVQSPLAAHWTESPVKGADKLPAGITVTNWTEKTLENRTRSRLLQVVEIDPTAAPLDLQSTVGPGGDGLAEKVADQLAGVSPVTSRHPLAGVNGGLFKSEPAHPDLKKDTRPLTLQHMGVSVTDGVLHSAGCFGRYGQGTNGAVIQYGVPYITRLSTELSLTAADRAFLRLDDINRDPGRARGCARDGDDEHQPEDQVNDQRGVYTDPDEVVLFTSDYKYPVPKPGLDPYVTTDDDPGFEVVLDSAGKVTAARPGRGGGQGNKTEVYVPSGGRILQGVGTGATWLRDHAQLGTVLTVSQKLKDMTFGREIPLDPSVDVVGSFHQLLRDGDVPAALPDTCNQKGAGADGTEICTDSRVALGTNVRGHTVLVTLTGQPQDSTTTTHEDGAWLHEFAELLDSEELGLIDALNLDGGGSATLITATTDAGTVVRTPPTDREDGVYVHRPVADAVYAGISGYGMYKKP